MARGRGRRDGLTIANDTLLDLVDPGPVPNRYVEDLRFDTPEVSPIPRTRGGKRSKIVPAAVAKTRRNKPVKAYSTFNQMAFERPREVLICIRRKTRREVLLAKGKGGANRPPRRSTWSHIHCRRK